MNAVLTPFTQERRREGELLLPGVAAVIHRAPTSVALRVDGPLVSNPRKRGSAQSTHSTNIRSGFASVRSRGPFRDSGARAIRTPGLG
jgi:hypothetical protein